MAENDRTVEFLPLGEHQTATEDDDMFTIQCPEHGCEVLLSESRIRALRLREEGITVDYECWCGHRGSFDSGRPVMVGRHRPAV